MRLAIFQTMGLGEVGPTERPIWFVVDELDALGKIDRLKDALARIRKFGGRCVLGFQSIAQAILTWAPAMQSDSVKVGRNFPKNRKRRYTNEFPSRRHDRDVAV